MSTLFNDCPCFGQTAASILLTSHHRCHCHSFRLHWTNSRRSSTASALSCLTVTAVLPYAMFPFQRYY